MKALILARGGSKGIPKKNITLLEGKPLLSYPILAAQKTKTINAIYVSTDSEEIAKVAIDYGAYIIERPAELAQDNSLDKDSFAHAVKYYFKNDYTPIVHLRATTPLIEAEELDRAVFLIDNIPYATSLRSAQEVPESIYKFFKLNGNYWEGFFPELKGEYYNYPRQNFPKNFIPNGYVDIVKPTVFMHEDTFHGNKILALITPRTFEIDSPEDLKQAEIYLKGIKNV